VCTIYEVGEEGEFLFIAMEYVEGRTLDALIANRPLSISSAADYAFQIVDALDHAHELGVIHGDLKTANILVSSKNRIKIVHFGLSRRQEDSAAISSMMTSVIAGPPYAMAPEQLRGGAPDIQTDVWSLGVVFFEMLAGSLPFGGATTAELATAILRDPPPALPEDVPVALRQVVERCLSKEAVQRYRSAGEVRAGLEVALGTRRSEVHYED